jgi:uncharacterized membrane protein HdeD (DUF308 family)
MRALHFGMEWWSVIDALSPHARVLSAIAPFAGAMTLRLVLGGNRITKGLISISTMWFLINVLLAPYSPAMLDDLTSLRELFR